MRLRFLRNLTVALAAVVAFVPGCGSDGTIDAGDRALAAGNAAAASRHYRAALEAGADAALVADRMQRCAIVERRDRVHAASAEALAAHGDLKAAVAEYRKALAVDPENVGNRRALAAALAKLGRHDEAEITLDELSAAGVDDAQLHTLAARIQYGRGDYTEALRELRVALRLDPAFTAARRALGRIEQEWAAIRTRREADGRAAFEAGVRALYAGNDERAFESLTASLSDAEPEEVGSIDPDRAGEAVAEPYGRAALYANLALACLRTGRGEEALAYLGALDEMTGRPAPLAFRIGRILEAKELWAEAAAQYEEARRRGGVPGLEAALGFALKKVGRYAESAEAFRAACLAEPDNPYLRYNLALLLKKTGDLAGAREELARAKELAPAGTTFAYTIEEHLLALERGGETGTDRM